MLKRTGFFYLLPFDKMYSKNKHLWTDLHRLREAISKKFKAFKEGNVETQIQLTKQYKPLLTQLEKTNTEFNSNRVKKEEFPGRIKEERGEEEEEEEEVDRYGTPSKEDVNRVYEEDEGEEEGEEEIEDGDTSSVFSDANSSATTLIKQSYDDPLIQGYMIDVFKNSRMSDHVFGPRFEGNTLMVGDGELKFNTDGSFTIKNIKYGKPTKGILELLFKVNPKGYNPKDLQVYKKILESTNAHKRDYKENNPINSSRSKKYTSLISPLFVSKKTLNTPKSGRGLLTKRLTNTTVLSHWDDPNELVERLRLLEASRLAGNTGVKNEIINIIEELREVGYILGRGNSRYRSLTQ